MNTSTLWYIFLAIVATLWTFLGLFTAVVFNGARLRAKGHDEEAVVFLKRDNRKRCLGIAIVLPLAALLAAGVVLLLFGGLSTYDHFVYSCILTLILIAPFPVLDFFQSRKKQKAFVVDGGRRVVIDLKYRVWHLVFRPGWEAVSTLLVISFFIWQGQYFNLAMLHLVLLWLLYLAGRGGKFMTGASISDLYQITFVFMAFNHLLVIFHLVRFTTYCCSSPSTAGFIAGLLLVGLMSLKLVYYFLKLPYFRGEIARLTKSRLSI